MAQVNLRSRRRAVLLLVGTFLIMPTVKAGPTLGPDTWHDFMAMAAVLEQQGNQRDACRTAMAIGRGPDEREETELGVARVAPRQPAMAIGRSLDEHEETELELAWMPSVGRYCGAMPAVETPSK